MSRLLTFIITLFVSMSLFGANAKAETLGFGKLFKKLPSVTVTDNKTNRTQTIESDYAKTAVKLDNDVMTNLKKSVSDKIILTDYPLQNRLVNLELVRAHSVVTENTEWVANTENGLINLSAPEVTTFKGTIGGNPNTKVLMTICGDQVFGYVLDEYQTKNLLLPLYTKENGLHIMAAEEQFVNQNKSIFTYDAPYSESDLPSYEQIMKTMANKIQSTTLMEADICIEATNDFYRLFNDTTKCKNYMIAVMSLASNMYESEVYLRLNVNYVLLQLNKATDPYASNPDIINRLYVMPNQWKSKPIKRALVCLFTNIANQNNGGYFVGGVSMSINTICNTNRGYCALGMYGNFVYPTVNYTWDVSCTAHELGHAFGSPHTHVCSFNPPIDTCVTKTKPQENYDACFDGNPVPNPGTIMSYCHLTNSSHSVAISLHPRNRPIVRTAIEAGSCIRVVGQPTLILFSPVGEESMLVGTDYTIQWKSAKVDYVALQVSTDSAKTWKYITEAMSSSINSYTWKVPKTPSDYVFIRIVDPYNLTTFDQNQIPFRIVSPTLSIAYPDTVLRFGQKENITVQWNKQYINSVRIEFKTDDDLTKWTVIADKQTGSQFKWDVPDIENEHCHIRVIAIDDESLISESPEFAIGKETFKLLKPAEGEVFCNNKNNVIEWQSDYISRIYFEFSTDGGTTWKFVRLSGVLPNPATLNWTIPKVFTNKALIRISSFADKTNPIYTSKIFSIDSCQINVVDNESVSALGSLDVLPNPVEGNSLRIKFVPAPSINRIDAFILDLTGRNVLDIAMSVSPEVINSRDISISSLSSGTYLFCIRSGGNLITKTFKIIR